MAPPEERLPTLEDVRAARAPVARVAHRTPVLTSRTLSELCGVRVLLKAENLQRTGAFKVRGAAARLAALSPEERARGVVAASAGNHAQGVALAGRLLGVPATVVMPREASLAKVQATRSYGARVLLEGDSFDAALERARALAREEGLTLVHAFDDPRVVAGQGTLGLELCEDAPDLDAVVVPVGGGGLIAGVALAVKGLCPRARVVGVQAEAAPAAARSFRAGRPLTVPAGPTLADGIAVGRPGDLVEGAGAVGLAALLRGGVAAPGQRVAVVLSGGNVDLNLLNHILDHGLAHAGRFQVFRVTLADRPGQLARVLAVLAAQDVNVLEVGHSRRAVDLPVGQVQVDIVAETRDPAHAEEVAVALEAAGYAREAQPPPPAGVLHFAGPEAAP